MDKCCHCGEPLSKKDKVCPRCGAEIQPPQEPKTIYELRWFCAQHNMPLAQMRFFLGEDYEGPRAFGIYQDDDGDFVVYKNKADGVRSVRYKGPDEAHAVHEIYQKLLSEIVQRKGGGLTAGAKTRGQYQTRSQQPQRKTRRRPAWIPPLVILMILTVVMTAAMIAFAFLRLRDRPSRGYYAYDDGYYYSRNGDWYYYDDDDWYPWEVDDDLRENYDDYYVGRTYDDSYGAEDFYDSDYDYESDDSWDDDSNDTWDDWDNDDSDYTWDDDWDDDWDDWDDDDTDWDSDW